MMQIEVSSFYSIGDFTMKMTASSTNIAFHELGLGNQEVVSRNDESTHSSILDSAHVRDVPEEHSKDSTRKIVENSSSSDSPTRGSLHSEHKEQKAFRLSKTIKKAKQKSRIFEAWAMGHDDDANSPLLNPNAMRGQRSLDLEDDNSLQENVGCDDSMRTTRRSNSSCSSSARFVSSSPKAPLQVLSPSFAVHQRSMKDRDWIMTKRVMSASPGQNNKPPLPPSSV